MGALDSFVALGRVVALVLVLVNLIGAYKARRRGDAEAELRHGLTAIFFAVMGND